MAHLKDTIFINAPVDNVSELATDPHRWSTWFVGLGEAESVEGDNGPGTVVQHSYLLAGMHFPVTTRVQERSGGAGEARRWKASIEGPLDGWQQWDYVPKGGGTEVTAEMDYTVPGSLLGKVADRLFLERNQERALRHTLENLKQLAES
jgi:uncharacterized membrane protein